MACRNLKEYQNKTVADLFADPCARVAISTYVADSQKGGNNSAGVTSFKGRTGPVSPENGDYLFIQIAGRPTTLAGYGITDALTVQQVRQAISVIGTGGSYDSSTGVITLTGGTSTTADGNNFPSSLTFTSGTLTLGRTGLSNLSISLDGRYSLLGHNHSQTEITGLIDALSSKQPTLVSGNNIKTINGVSILGVGDISTGSGGTSISLTTIGNSGPATFISGVLNIPQYSAGTGGVTSFNGRMGPVLPQANDYTFSQIGSRPTTISGYGITDAFTKIQADLLYSPIVHSHTFASLTSKPTTLSGYGITDSVVFTTGTYVNPTWISSLAYGKITGAPTSLSQFTNDSSFITASSTTVLTNKTISGNNNTLTNITQSSIVNLVNDLNNKANLSSPSLLGIPTAPNPSVGNNSTQIATTSFVQAAIASVPTGGGTSGQSLDVRSFGIVGDGSNEGVKLQNAMQTAANLGKELLIENITISIGATPFSNGNNITFVGGGKLTITGRNGVIKLIPNSLTDTSLNPARGLLFTSMTKLVINNVEFDGDGMPGNPTAGMRFIYTNGGSHFTMRDCRIINNKHIGICTVDTSDVLIDHNEILNADSCIFILGDCRRIEVINNSCIGGTSEGICIFTSNQSANTEQRPSNFIVDNNFVQNKLGSYGINICNVQRGVVSNNDILNCLGGMMFYDRGSGTRADQYSIYVNIHDNHMWDCVNGINNIGTGFSVDNNHFHNISRTAMLTCSYENSDGSLDSVTRAYGVSITNNHIYESTHPDEDEWPIVILYGLVDSKFTNNQNYNTNTSTPSYRGIYVDSCANLLVENNFMRKTRFSLAYGTVFNTTTPSWIKNNFFQDIKIMDVNSNRIALSSTPGWTVTPNTTLS